MSSASVRDKYMTDVKYTYATTRFSMLREHRETVRPCTGIYDVPDVVLLFPMRVELVSAAQKSKSVANISLGVFKVRYCVLRFNLHHNNIMEMIYK